MGLKHEQTLESKSVALNDMSTVQIDHIDQDDKIRNSEHANESISFLIRSKQPTDIKSNKISHSISESIFQTDFFDIRVEYSLYLFSKENSFRKFCSYLTLNKWFKSILTFFVALNCITLAMERPSIAPSSLVSILN